jgi:uncharacterized protein YfaS (alpha-2-macroglobulin family)
VTEITVKNDGSGSGYVSWVTDGVPLKAALEEARGIRVSVGYRDSSGAPLSRNPVVLRGQKLIGTIRLEPLASTAENIAVSLPFAGGLEIENPRLMDSQEDAERGSLSGVRVEMRDDRLLLFVDKLERALEWKFSMRAVTEGEFALPPIAAEGMYSPGARSTGETSRVVIKAR